MTIIINQVNYIRTTVSQSTTSRNEEADHYIRKTPPKPEKLDSSQLTSLNSSSENSAGGVMHTVHQWIEAHEEGLQAAASEAAESVKFIDFDTFILKLKVSYDDILTNLAPLYSGNFDPKEHAIALVEGKKSNKWVAELIASEHPHGEAYAYVRLGEKEAREFQNLIEQSPKEKNDDLINQFKNKTLLLFDDGSYSGTQMCDHLKHILTLIAEHHLGVTAIAVIIPYMTVHAKQKLEQLALSSSDVKVLISKSEDIQTLNHIKSVRTKTHLAQMWYKNDFQALQKIGTIWLEHKVPNDQSFPGPLLRGSVFNSDGKSRDISVQIIPDLTPPYKYASPLENQENIHKVSPKLIRGGQLNESVYAQLKETQNVQVVINLRETDEGPSSFLVKDLGIEYVHIPFNATRITDDIVIQFLKTLITHKEKTVFVHCLHGSDRTGVLVAISKMLFNKELAEAIKAKKPREELELIAKNIKDSAIKDMLDPKYGFHRLTHNHLLQYAKDFDILKMIDTLKKPSDSK
jgi:protein tyrosine phosphatase (PTP) superfamily phosphohydrolase (DUF442 family)